MSDEKHCWVVASGDYSDVQTHGIYTAEAAAEDAVEAAEAELSDRDWKWSDYRVERWPLDIWGTSYHSVDRVKQVYKVNMYENGDLANNVGGGKGPIGTRALTAWEICGFRSGGPELRVQCVAYSERQAIKIANDIRIQILAGNGWEVGKANFTTEKVGKGWVRTMNDSNGDGNE